MWSFGDVAVCVWQVPTENLPETQVFLGKRKGGSLEMGCGDYALAGRGSACGEVEGSEGRMIRVLHVTVRCMLYCLR